MHFLFALFFLMALLHAEPQRVRIGHFPNLTHAQAVLGHAATEGGERYFEERMGDVILEWYLFPSGGPGMEGILSGALDLCYVGPSPAINAHVVTQGEAIRVVAGGCLGGSGLVVSSSSGIVAINDFAGKRIATPQLGGTQDVTLRAWLLANGYQITFTGGDVQILPMANASQLALFQTGQLDGAFTAEPWVSRLIIEGGGTLFLDEGALWPETNGRYATTIVVASTKFLRDQPELATKFLRAHVEMTEWIKSHPQEAITKIGKEIMREIHQALPKPVVERAFKNIELTWDAVPESLRRDAKEAYQVGFFKEMPNLETLFDLSFLDRAIREKNNAP